VTGGNPPEGGTKPGLWASALVALPAFLILLGLGTWQMQRLEWKAQLLATIEARQAAAPIPLPAELDPEQLTTLSYRRVTVSGTFLHDRELLLLARTRKKIGGAVGAHVLTPMVTTDGRAVLVNRGWVPHDSMAPTRRSQGQVQGQATVTGVLRTPPAPGPFTPDNRPDVDEWYWIDLAAMATATALDLLPVVVAADATANPGGLPIGGQTRLDVRNDHLQYALTWYSLAAGLAVIFVLYHRRER